MIAAMSPSPAGGKQLTVRDASYSEVLKDLTVKGDLDMSNLDVNRIEIEADQDSTSASIITSQSSMPTRLLATTFKQSICEGSIGDRDKGESSEIKCKVKKNDSSDFEVALNVGVRDLLLKGVNISPITREISVGNFSVTPFIGVSATILSADNKPQNITKSFPILSVQPPVASTYGFVNFAIPVSLDFSLPLFKFAVSAELSGKYANGSFTPQGTITTPVATLGTAKIFKYEGKGQVFGVIGAELALTEFPHVRPLIDIFKPSLPDRMLSVGVFFKKGIEGTLSIDVSTLNSKPCFTWSLQGKSGFTGVAKAGTNPLLELASLTPFGLVTSGSDGCNALGPSPGGFALRELACTKNANGTASITGLYSAELAPGEQITVAAWSTEYLTSGPGSTCANPTYKFPDNRQFGIPGEFVSSTCTPPDGLSLNPVSYAACHNPLSGTTRNIWVQVQGGVSSSLSNGGSVLVSVCRATTVNLNGSIPPGSRPTISIDKTIACTPAK